MIEWEAAVRDTRRLEAVRESGLVQTGPEDEFDRFVELAWKITGATWSCISLVDAETVDCKSSVGLPEGMPLPLRVLDTFCRYVVGSGSPFIVDDAAHDSRVFDDPTVVAFEIGAWAGYPITDPDGYILGTLCVMDSQPRVWGEVDILVLATLARAVSTEIALRKSHVALRNARLELEELRQYSSVPL
jgi:GAF domain-containing protein